MKLPAQLAFVVAFAYVGFLRADVVFVAEQQQLRISVVAEGGSIEPFADNLGLVYGLTLDSMGNVYVAAAGDDTIRRVSPQGLVSVVAQTTMLGSPLGIAFDGAGFLYTVGGGWGGRVARVDSAGSVSIFASNLGFATDLAFDSLGDLFVASHSGGGSIYRVSTAGDVSTLVSGVGRPWGLEFDASGALYFADAEGDRIGRISTDGVVSTFATGFLSPAGMAFGSSGELFVTDVADGTLKKVSPDGTVTLVAQGLHAPYAVAVAVPEPCIAISLVAGLTLLLGSRSVRRW